MKQIDFINLHIQRITFLIFAGTAVLFLFWPTMWSYFFQDDWFSLFISQAKNVNQFLGFFRPRPELIYYRPLGMQVPFFLVQSLFGLNPFVFRIATVVVHSINGMLVFALFKSFTVNKKKALLGSFLYLTSSIHLTIFYWAATFAFVLGPTYYLGSLLAFIQGKKKLSISLFFLGLLTNELVISLPFVIITWCILFKKRKRITEVLAHSILVAIYAVFRLTIARIPIEGGYTLLGNGTDFLKNIRDYFLWLAGWPEEVHNQFVAFAKLNPVFIHEFKFQIAVFTILTILVSLLFMRRIRKLLQPAIVWPEKLPAIFGGIWFWLALAPVLFFSHHAFSYYLPIPAVGLLLFLVGGDRFHQDTFFPRIELIGMSLFLAFWYFTSSQNIAFNKFVHWAPRRAEISKRAITLLKTTYPVVEEDTVFILPRQDELNFALGDESALKVIYGPDITTFYGSLPEWKLKNSERKHIYDINSL